MLKSYVAIFVPSNTPAEKAISIQVRTKLATLFGGCTTFHTTGSYITEAGEYMEENMDMCKSFTDGTIDASVIIDMAEYIKKVLFQESVAYEINGEMFFV